MRHCLLAVPLLVLLTGISFPQQFKKSSRPLGVFAFAYSPRHLVAVSNDLDATQARRLTKAVCPTSKISAEVSLTMRGNAARSAFEYDANSDVPAGNYCLLVDEQAHPSLFTWGSGDEPILKNEKACLGQITQAAERLTGRIARTCYLIGVYGTGRVDLIEFVSDTPEDRLVGLLMTDESLDGSGSSIVQFLASSPVWSRERDGKFHPERFRHLFTISDDPDSNLWTIAVDWADPSEHVLTLYQPKGAELIPLLVNRDSSRRAKIAESEAALR